MANTRRAKFARIPVGIPIPIGDGDGDVNRFSDGDGDEAEKRGWGWSGVGVDMAYLMYWIRRIGVSWSSGPQLTSSRNIHIQYLNNANWLLRYDVLSLFPLWYW
ncbi:hypothetical protein Tco_0089155 [Tanacetum coccineum]